MKGGGLAYPCPSVVASMLILLTWGTRILCVGQSDRGLPLLALPEGASARPVATAHADIGLGDEVSGARGAIAGRISLEVTVVSVASTGSHHRTS